MELEMKKVDELVESMPSSDAISGVCRASSYFKYYFDPGLNQRLQWNSDLTTWRDATLGFHYCHNAVMAFVSCAADYTRSRGLLTP